MTTTEPERDLFEGADSAASICAYLYTEHGEAVLRQTLKLVVDDTTEGADFTREEFLRDVRELTAIGLDHVAGIVQEATETVPTEVDRIIRLHGGSKANLKAKLAQLRDIDLTSL